MMTGCEDDRALTALPEDVEDIWDMLESAGEPTRPLREYLSKRMASGSGRAGRAANILVQLCERGQASELVERVLERLLAYETGVCRAQLGQLQSDLAELEARHGLSSDEFYRRYQAGQTDDRMDYVEWASLVQMRDNLHERLRILTGEMQPVS